MRATFSYTALRLGLFVVVFLVLYGAGARSILLLGLALVISGVISYFVLSPQRNAMAGAIGKSALSQYFVAEQPYAPASGPGWQVFNKHLLASATVPKPAQWSTDSYTMTDYDSVVVMALAATAVNSTNPAVWNASIPAVTEPGPGKTVVTSFAAGKAALAAGKKIQYVGASGVIDFNKWHNSGGSFEIGAYQPNGDLTPVTTITAAELAPLIK